MSDSDNKNVRVGVGVWIFNPDGCVLLGRRLSKHGRGMWAPPGGHLEFGETPIDAAIREVREETGLIIKPADVYEFSYTNDIFPDKHYITIHCCVEKFIGSPQIKEVDKCVIWRWCNMDDLPKPLFLPVENLLKQNIFERE